MLNASCHCGNIQLTMPKPESLTSCNCSICHRLAALWGNYPPKEVSLNIHQGGTEIYSHGDEYIHFHRCGKCGCTTHYTLTEKAGREKTAVNFRMVDPAAAQDIRIRLFDGADTWTFIDE